jgi:hypothetical protein
MNNETKETLMKVAEYTNEEKKKLKKRMTGMMLCAVLMLVFCAILFETRGFGGWIAERPCRNMISFTLGLSSATLVLNVLHLQGILDKLREKKLSFKNRAK